MSKPAPPEHLKDPGVSLWVEVVGTYDLRADELRVLGAACAAADMVDAFESSWRDEGYPLTTKGSMGQLVEHPLIGSIDKQRKALAAFLKQLRLPDEAATKTNAQREGGATRWANAHGA
jgi:hypothetical protein